MIVCPWILLVRGEGSEGRAPELIVTKPARFVQNVCFLGYITLPTELHSYITATGMQISW